MTTRSISPWNAKSSPYVIAEIGSNHDGDKGRALELIAKVAAAGADAAKFQLFRASTLVVSGHPAFATLERLSTPLEWLPELAAACRKAGIDFSATPFNLEAVDALSACSPAFIKIASSDITFVSLLRRCAATGVPIILSTGMSTRDEVDQAWLCLKAAGAVEVALLHCVSMYPPAFADMNLQVIPRLAQHFNCPVGLSDHTPGSIMAVAAVTLGGGIIEKHVTDDRRRSGPDHAYALEFSGLAQLVNDVRDTAAAMGEGDKGPRGAEENIKIKARRGLYAACDIAAGETLVESKILALRPTAEVNAEQIDRIVGLQSPLAIAAGKPLPASLVAAGIP